MIMIAIITLSFSKDEGERAQVGVIEMREARERQAVPYIDDNNNNLLLPYNEKDTGEESLSDCTISKAQTAPCSQGAEMRETEKRQVLFFS